MISDPIKLSRLRDIGWRQWDPIGLLTSGEPWDHKPFAGEYDAYLLRAAGDLRHGRSFEQVVAYLLGVEREHMGLGIRSDQETRVETTVFLIQRYMAELDERDSTST